MAPGRENRGRNDRKHWGETEETNRERYFPDGQFCLLNSWCVVHWAYRLEDAAGSFRKDL